MAIVCLNLANNLANRAQLKVTPFKNPSGTLAWRLSGTVRKQRIRQNFSTQGEAETARAEMLAGIIDDPPPSPISTHLSPEQVRAAEAAFHELPDGVRLSDVVRFWREHARPVADSTAVSAAANLWESWLLEQRKAKPETASAWKNTVGQFARETQARTMRSITSEVARRWIFDDRLAVRSQRDRFDILNYFGRWAVRNKLLLTNPIEALDRPVVKNDAPPTVLSVDDIRRLLQAALTDAEGPEMLPYFAIASLSGVRPEEIPDLDDESLWLDDHALIEVNRTKGGRRRRNAEICEPLRRILEWCRTQGLKPGTWSRRKFRRIRERAGLYHRWSKDVLRHTYASHHYAAHRDVKRLTASMGNSEDVLFQHYIRPVARAEASRFFALELDYTAPREPSAEGARIDRYLVLPPEKMSLEQLRLLAASLARQIARAEKRGENCPEHREKLGAVRAAIEARADN